MTQLQVASRVPATQAGGRVSSRMPGPAEKPAPQATAVTALRCPGSLAGTQQSKRRLQWRGVTGKPSEAQRRWLRWLAGVIGR